MVWIETFYGFVANENFCTPAPPLPPLLGDFAKNRKKFDWSKCFVVGESDG